MNVEIYPDYANGWDSLAEACMLNGDNDEAIQNYNKSLELNPDNKYAIEALKKINEKMNIE